MGSSVRKKAKKNSPERRESGIVREALKSEAGVNAVDWKTLAVGFQGLKDLFYGGGNLDVNQGAVVLLLAENVCNGLGGQERCVLRCHGDENEKG